MRDYRRRLLALDDAELEHFARDWVALKKNVYFEVKPCSGPKDLGRDVVGFLTKKRHEGPWHNYQCKQYTRRRLPLGNGLFELGKILYHASTGAFTTPTGYHFVAPHGISRDLEGLVDKPEPLRKALMDGWDKYCGTSIIEGETVPLDTKLRTVIEAYDFSLVTRISLEEMLAADDVRLVLHRHFGADPGPAPQTPAPAEVQAEELGYITELVGAYGARDGATYKAHEDNYDDALGRHDAVMTEAGKLVLSAPLGQHARVTVKQGYCHHLANDGKMTWRKK